MKMGIREGVIRDPAAMISFQMYGAVYNHIVLIACKAETNIKQMAKHKCFDEHGEQNFHHVGCLGHDVHPMVTAVCGARMTMA